MVFDIILENEGLSFVFCRMPMRFSISFRIFFEKENLAKQIQFGGQEGSPNT